MKRIIITGPESTGKTTLAMELSSHFRMPWIPEYAREYLETLNRKYLYDDVEAIAREQVKQVEGFSSKPNTMLFVDTFLEITIVWFEEVYHKVPDWVVKAFSLSRADLYLVCEPDIPWYPDPLRENPGEARHRLMQRYIQLLEEYGYPYRMVNGEGDERVKQAIDWVTEMLNHNETTF